MPTLSIRFPAGHYHATPWDKAQNEGAVEWPPSPWRLLRALIATGYAKLPEWLEGTPPPVARSLVERLAGVLPAYKLPPVTGAHTRHYMPIEGNKTTLVLDARAVTGSDHAPLLVHWNIALPPEEQALFDALAARLGYLGRAESWAVCESIAAPAAPPALADGWTIPHDTAAGTTGVGASATGVTGASTAGAGFSRAVGAHADQLPLLVPLPAADYAAWLAGQPKRRRGAPPLALFDALQVETSWLQKHGWTAPPGSRLVIYDSPDASAAALAPPMRRPAPTRPTVEFVLLALAADVRSRTPLPLVTRTLPQAELLHRAIASKIGKLATGNAIAAGSAAIAGSTTAAAATQSSSRGGVHAAPAATIATAAAELLGLAPDRCPIPGHRHARIFPLSLLNADNHLDHILIYAAGGLTACSQDILRSLRKTYMKGGVGELEVRFAGAGNRADFLKIPALRHLLAPARIWQSVTPLVLSRHRKKHGVNTLEGQIAAECALLGIPAPEQIEILKDESIALRHFVRTRRDGAAPPSDYGYALRLTFPEPVSGPLSLGHSSHFGLGLFAPAAVPRT